MKVRADIIGIKFSENEMKRWEAKGSPQELGLAYQKAVKGNEWETFIFTPSFGMLPLDTWKEIATRGITASGAGQPLVGNVSAPTLIANKYLYEVESVQICPNCNAPFTQENAKFCPLCGKTLPNVPKSNTKTDKTGVP